MIPRATYRLQLHKGFTFADAQAIVPYLDRLGISHVYASPITTAAPGSTHGYDVVDPTRINPELGGEAGFRSLVAALRARGMGVVLDIVPNHMGVAGDSNAWWRDVLAKGEDSEHARVFDIDWREPIVLPVLETPLAVALAAGDIAAERGKDGRLEIVVRGEQRYPAREAGPAEAAAPIAELLARQPYRLAWWRAANDALNWRRFFAVNELAGVRVEDAAVFEATHALVFRLYAEGLIDGVRVDHVDGLSDPAGYCRRLRQRLDALDRPADAPPGPAWIVVEKILGPGEALAEDWGVDGTSGYDFMEQAALVLHDARGAEALGRLWAQVGGREADFAPEARRARQQVLSWQFGGQLAACVEAFHALAASAPETSGLTAGMLRRAIERLVWVFPVYRTYGLGDAAPAADAAIRKTARRRVTPLVPPGEAGVIDHVLDWLAGAGPGDAALAFEAVRRFQQLSAPISAKALEDTAFYRYGRLLSRNDVGFDPARMAMSVADFHSAMQARAARWPHAMLTTATHDHKRGEDARARLAALSAVPQRWAEAVVRWEAIAAPFSAGIDRGDRYMLFQTLVGAWPQAGVDGAFVARILAWQQKALREAKLRSSWAAPDAAYEEKAAGLVRQLLGRAAFVDAVEAFLAEIAPIAAANTLVQAALRCTVPGVPDLYQGCELDDFSLVDPDNRRPVDYAARAIALDDPPPKLKLLARLLGLRRDHPDLFGQGDYAPATVRGRQAAHVLAFERRCGATRLRCAFALHGVCDWADTEVAFEGETRPTAALFADGPVHIDLHAG